MPSFLRPVAALLAVLLLTSAEVRADILYITDPSANAIYQISAGGPTGGVITDNDRLPTPLAPLTDPRGVVLDASGNLYVADASANTIYKFTRNSSGGLLNYGDFNQTVFATGPNLSSPYGLALDKSGNLYVANIGNGSVTKIGPNGDTTNGGTVIVPASTLSFPQGIAIGPTGLLYVTPFFSGAVNVFTNTGTAVGQVFTGGYSPIGVTFDQAGNLYISEVLNGSPSRVVQQPIGSNGLATGTPNNFYTGFGMAAPGGLAFDPQGQLYVLDGGFSPGNLDRVPPGGGGFVIFKTGFANPAFIAVFATPEPSSLALLGMAASAMAGYGWWGRRRRLTATSLSD
jgi:DNA-binding beta-propeller fold protein YncE